MNKNKNIKNFLAQDSLFKKSKSFRNELVNNKISIIGKSTSNFQINPPSDIPTQQKNYVNFLSRQQDNHYNYDQKYQRNDMLPPTIKRQLFHKKLSKNNDLKTQERQSQLMNYSLQDAKKNQYFGYAFEINNPKVGIEVRDMEQVLTNSFNLSKSSSSKDKIEKKIIVDNIQIVNENSTIKTIQSQQQVVSQRHTIKSLENRQLCLDKGSISEGFQTIKQQSIAYLTKLKNQLQSSYLKLQITDKLIYNSILNNIKNQTQKIKHAFNQIMDKSIEKFTLQFNARQKKMKMIICPQLEEIKSNMEQRLQQIKLLEKQIHQNNWQNAFNNLIDYSLERKILFTLEKQKQIESNIKNVVIAHENKLKIEISQQMKNSIHKKIIEIVDDIFKHVQTKQLFLYLQKMSQLYNPDFQ